MNIIRRVLLKLKFGYKSDSESFIKYLKSKGVTIGEGCSFYGANQIYVDIQYPFLITICNNVVFAPGCRLITHDFSWSTLKLNYYEVLGGSGEIYIGDNTFIGSDSLILRNSHIGKNCIIGAGSLVSGVIPDNSVAVGRPAKVIMTINDLYIKRKKYQLEEAVTLFKIYYSKFSKIPDESVLREYFWLFKNDLNNLSLSQNRLLGNDKKAIETFINHKAQFKSYDDFIKYCLREIENEK